MSGNGQQTKSDELAAPSRESDAANLAGTDVSPASRDRYNFAGMTRELTAALEEGTQDVAGEDLEVSASPKDEASSSLSTSGEASSTRPAARATAPLEGQNPGLGKEDGGESADDHSLPDSRVTDLKDATPTRQVANPLMDEGPGELPKESPIQGDPRGDRPSPSGSFQAWLDKFCHNQPDQSYEEWMLGELTPELRDELLGHFAAETGVSPSDTLSVSTLRNKALALFANPVLSTEAMLFLQDRWGFTDQEVADEHRRRADAATRSVLQAPSASPQNNLSFLGAAPTVAGTPPVAASTAVRSRRKLPGMPSDQGAIPKYPGLGLEAGYNLLEADIPAPKTYNRKMPTYQAAAPAGRDSVSLDQFTKLEQEFHYQRLELDRFQARHDELLGMLTARDRDFQQLQDSGKQLKAMIVGMGQGQTQRTRIFDQRFQGLDQTMNKITDAQMRILADTQRVEQRLHVSLAEMRDENARNAGEMAQRERRIDDLLTRMEALESRLLVADQRMEEQIVVPPPTASAVDTDAHARADYTFTAPEGCSQEEMKRRITQFVSSLPPQYSAIFQPPGYTEEPEVQTERVLPPVVEAEPLPTKPIQATEAAESHVSFHSSLEQSSRSGWNSNTRRAGFPVIGNKLAPEVIGRFGEDTPDMTLQHFIRKIEMFAADAGWSDADTGKAARACLKGRALDVVMALEDPEDLNSWDVIRKVLSEEFNSIAARKSAKLELEKMKRESNVKVRSFGTKIDRLINIAYCDRTKAARDEFACDAFLRGLNNKELYCYLEEKRGFSRRTSLRELIGLAEAWLSIHSEPSTVTGTVAATVPKTAAIVPESKQKPASSSTSQRGRGGRGRSGFRPGAKAKTEAKVAGTGRGSGDQDPTQLFQQLGRWVAENALHQQDYQRCTGVCWRCGRQGHRKANCPQGQFCSLRGNATVECPGGAGKPCECSCADHAHFGYGHTSTSS